MNNPYPKCPIHPNHVIILPLNSWLGGVGLWSFDFMPLTKSRFYAKGTSIHDNNERLVEGVAHNNL
jgi:hypothetical protein